MALDQEKFKELMAERDLAMAAAQVIYDKYVEEDKNKDYMDLLPPEFRTFKRSIIMRDVLLRIDEVTRVLNECGLYGDRVFDKKEVVRYMLCIASGSEERHYGVAKMFIPKEDFFSMYVDRLHRKSKGQVVEDVPGDQETHENVERWLSYLKQSWEAYLSKKHIQQGIVEEGDLEEDGYPRASRGNLCGIYLPVENLCNAGKKAKKLTLYNPRSKKDEVYTVEGYKAEDGVYKCINPKGKTVFLADADEVRDAWDCLFPINKEIFGGWWNRIMELR
jgi:hypothetical protein